MPVQLDEQQIKRLAKFQRESRLVLIVGLIGVMLAVIGFFLVPKNLAEHSIYTPSGEIQLLIDRLNDIHPETEVDKDLVEKAKIMIEGSLETVNTVQTAYVKLMLIGLFLVGTIGVSFGVYLIQAGRFMQELVR